MAESEGGDDQDTSRVAICCTRTLCGRVSVCLGGQAFNEGVDLGFKVADGPRPKLDRFWEIRVSFQFSVPRRAAKACAMERLWKADNAIFRHAEPLGFCWHVDLIKQEISPDHGGKLSSGIFL